jgi:hypothetical protein
MQAIVQGDSSRVQRGKDLSLYREFQTSIIQYDGKNNARVNSVF